MAANSARGAVEEVQAEHGEPVRRPSPTSRARRVAAAGVEKARPGQATQAAPKPGPAAEESPGPPEDARPAQDAPGADSGARSPRRVLTYGLAAIAIALVVLNVVLLVLPGGRSNSQAARDQVLAAAKSDTALVISYDYRSVESGAAKALPHLTGAFAADYRKSIDSVIKVQAPKVKAVVEGQVDSAGIEAVSGSGKQVTVVVFGQQKVTNSTLSQPRVDLVRLRVTMDKVDGQWKISKLDQI